MVNIIKGNPSDYRVGVPAVKGFNQDCREFPGVWHVTHAFRAPEILRAGTVSARLVYDNSTLNQTRIHVVWASPNDWAYGFRYGNVSLGFDWTKLLSTRKSF